MIQKSFLLTLLHLGPVVAWGFAIADLGTAAQSLLLHEQQHAAAAAAKMLAFSSSIPPEVSPHDFFQHSTMLASQQQPLFNTNLLELYKGILSEHPLVTKMMTGATLAVCGDAIAQSQTEDPYDKRRALSFAGFDSIYRAVQHFSFPAIVQHCQGQYVGALVAAAASTAGPTAALVKGLEDSLGANPSYYYGALEQTLASQLGIVPFFYYPVFYTVTAFVQGLSREGAIQRAKDTFLPLMKRNLLFWIPVQFIQFGFVDENLQIPFLSVAGLMWTFIISLFAGNAKASSSVPKDVVQPAYVVDNTGNSQYEHCKDEIVGGSNTSTSDVVLCAKRNNIHNIVDKRESESKKAAVSLR